MQNQVQVKPYGYTVRWVSYLDLLGFTELINTKGWIQVFSYYDTAVARCTADFGFKPKIEKTWFSDTFLLYSPDDKPASFAAIEATTRWFIYNLIRDGIPVRGSMSHGNLYADKKASTFFGPALIEAYHYGENQDWIGFVLTPSAVNQMAAIGLDANNRLNYAYWDIPYKKATHGAGALNLQKSLPAYIIGDSVQVNGRNLCLDKLCGMKDRLKDDRLTRKYENTITFIVNNKRTLVKDSQNIPIA
jgi:hypothetical protein